MKRMMNLTTCAEDLERFQDRADLERFYRSFGLNGLEVMEVEEDSRHLIGPENVIGVHLKYFSCWMDLWTGNRDRLMAEFGSPASCAQVFGGTTRQAVLETYRKNLAFAGRLDPEYLVFHVSECTIAESMLRKYHYTDEEVVDAAAEVVNEITRGMKPGPLLLFENLWYSGLTLLRPEITYRLLERVEYPNKGIMLDIGHLVHTNPRIRTPGEALDYVRRVLGQYPDLSFLKGVHLHLTLSGEYAEKCIREWKPTQGSYYDRLFDVMGHIFKIDAHQPFCDEGLSPFLETLPIDYLVLEQISSSRAEHAAQLAKQMEYLY